MRLNHECVRDFLLTLEGLTENEYIDCNDHTEFESLQKYEKSDVVYTFQKLEEANYINAKVFKSLGGTSYNAMSITWDGHQFLDNIRDNSVWSGTKDKVFSAVSSVSLPILAEVAGSYIKSKLGLS
ncbi:DUF2513 domain-containing protein [Paenibacillus apis]|uniref:DUF2513 domain-containing protein n=1 Tax=Paenibacillus apis TaxID=1792174 RepID=A0A919Y4Y0_9BACL|nr:DUF2513 domain-containing protein [Paenibacillus apis]GIO42468.1 DUF2513 domain-containing protein [Paenibacillus apis]